MSVSEYQIKQEGKYEYLVGEGGRYWFKNREYVYSEDGKDKIGYAVAIHDSKYQYELKDNKGHRIGFVR